MNTRIRNIRKNAGLTLDKFAALIGISGPAVSQIENGKTLPSQQTINAICSKFNVNEEWIKTGEGEMFIQRSRKEQIAEFFADVEIDPDDSIKVKIVEILAQLTVEDWEYLGELFDRIANRKEES